MKIIRLYKKGSAVFIDTEIKIHQIEINDEVVGEVEATQENMDKYFPKTEKPQTQKAGTVVV